LIDSIIECNAQPLRKEGFLFTFDTHMKIDIAADNKYIPDENTRPYWRIVMVIYHGLLPDDQ